MSYAYSAFNYPQKRSFARSLTNASFEIKIRIAVAPSETKVFLRTTYVVQCLQWPSQRGTFQYQAEGTYLALICPPLYVIDINLDKEKPHATSVLQHLRRNACICGG